MGYPRVRPRRLRRGSVWRAMVRESRLSREQLVMPLFVSEVIDEPVPIASMPGQRQHTITSLIEEARELYERGVPGVILFGIPEVKDARGSQGYSLDAIVPRSIAALKDALPDLLVMADVCLCEYTDHGHCGVLKMGEVDNDETLPLLAQEAVTYAKAGADVIAPSDMMDGRVGAVRTALDHAGFQDLAIVAYSVKYASAFYGPFRDAAQSAPQQGDRKGYQMDPANVREAMREAELDLEEGADVLMVKPALAYLDVLAKLRERFDVPIAAYNVSGEYAMVEAAAAAGWLDRKSTILESLGSIRRAGADILLTYWAKEVAEWL
ncbi:MAG: porphobilinogen synthase [Planctomycetota bacterium]